ncbi:MAG: hypothetical protein KIT84_18635 [Labilithrix sp.]|nr:hypothetical protein [Labilithrix sp.]MCW5813051.1 hypothetical protein [Labilithrix sp.]
MSQEKAAPPARSFDVAIVCALHSPELHEVLNAFGGESKWQSQPDFGQTHIYKSIDVPLSGAPPLSVVAGAPTHMGLTATAIISTQMLLMFRPRLIVMVGIAAGTKASGRNYGDILVANPSVDYASGKIAVVDGVETFQPDPFPLPVDSRLHTLVQEDRRTREGLDEIAGTWGGARPRTSLNIHIGALGAADQVVDSEKRILDIKKNWRKLIGVEMETYALYRAAHEAPRPKPLYVSFKSVCDFAAAKDDAWQEYAAFTAAQYCRRFLLKNWSVLSA